MTCLQLAGGGASLQICRVSRTVGGASKARFVFCERQGISSTANKKKGSFMMLLLLFERKWINICVIWWAR
jgi:hypothetical protein